MRSKQWIVRLPGQVHQGQVGPRPPDSNTFPVRGLPWTRRALAGLTVCLAGCVSLTGEDPTLRTPGGLIDDEVVERMAARRISDASENLAASHIKVNSYDGIVLLTGQVESESLRDLAQRSVSDVKKIRRVHNELTIGGPTSLVARVNDNWLETKVRSHLIANHDAPSARIKVVVEDGVVYLIGIVTRAQADATVDVARSVFGVQKVVKVFDYLGEKPGR